MLAVCAAGAPAPARAEGARASAKTYYERGTTDYNLGHFDEAIKAYEQAYEVDHAPILLFNIAQAHRQLGNNERAVFFYRRYLENAPKDVDNRSLVETRIKDLEELLQKQTELKQKPPTSVGKEQAETVSAGGERPATQASTRTPEPPPVQPESNLAAAPSNATDVSTSTAFKAQPPVAAPNAPRPLRFGLDLGPEIANFAGSQIASPTIFCVRIFGGYSFALGDGAVDVGGALSLSPLQYQRTDNGAQSLSSLFGAFLRGGVQYPIAVEGALHAIGDLGLGVIWWSGLGSKNPFTVSGVPATGAIAMPTVRIAAGLQYDLPRHFFVYLLPAYTFSKTTSGIESVVSHVGLIDIPLGIGRTF